MGSSLYKARSAPSFVSQIRNILHHIHHQRNHRKAGVFWGAFFTCQKKAFEGCRRV